MPISFHKRAARAGKSVTATLNDSAQIRLAWCLRATNELFKVKATTSTVMRRAITLFQSHLETLLVAEGTNGDMLRAFEVAQLRLANKGTQKLGISLDKVKAIPVLKPLHQLIADLPQAPKVIDILRQDLLRWEKTKAANQITNREEGTNEKA